MAVIAIVAFYLGLLNTILARFAGTCTQGDADRLWGVAISIPLFLVAVIALSRTSYVRATVSVCIPAFLLMLWQAVFAAELSFKVLVLNSSACEVLDGLPQIHDGDEFAFAFLWPIAIFGTLMAMVSVYFLRRTQAPVRRRKRS
jgi:hypothetical protein